MDSPQHASRVEQEIQRILDDSVIEIDAPQIQDAMDQRTNCTVYIFSQDAKVPKRLGNWIEKTLDVSVTAKGDILQPQETGLQPAFAPKLEFSANADILQDMFPTALSTPEAVQQAIEDKLNAIQLAS